MRRAASVAAIVLLWPCAAVAEPAPKRNALSYEPFAITSRGFLGQYERLVWKRASVVGGLGGRAGARGDFSSLTWTLHTEGRWYLVRREALSGVRGVAGPYLALGVDLAHTSLHDQVDDRPLGGSWSLVESGKFGYRFVAWELQEITPTVGFAVVHAFDDRGRLAPSTRVSVFSLGLTVGWVF